MKTTMRLIVCALALALGPALSGAQVMTGKDSAMRHESMGSGWMELDAFHKLLMDTWHPAQKGDLKPARQKAADLVKAAGAWAASKGPAACDVAAMRGALPQIVADVKAYAGVVDNDGTNDAVKAALKKAHDGFEKAAMPCMMAAMKDMKAMKKP